MPPVILGVGALLAFFLVRHYAIRRVTPGHGRWIWIVFAPLLLGAVVLLWAAGRMLAEDPWFGALLAVVAVLYVAATVAMVDRMSRGISAARTRDDVEHAVTDPFVDHQLTMIGGLLIGGLIAVVALIVYGVSQAAR